MMGFCVTAWMSQKQLKQRATGQNRTRLLVLMNLAAATVCVLGIALGAFSGPGAVELYLLFLPAAVFGLNTYAVASME